VTVTLRSGERLSAGAAGVTAPLGGLLRQIGEQAAVVLGDGDHERGVAEDRGGLLVAGLRGLVDDLRGHPVEVAADELGQPGGEALHAAPDGLRGDGRAGRERLHAAAVAAAAGDPARLHDQMADLPRRAAQPEDRPAVGDDAAADARADSDEQRGVRAPRRAEPVLGDDEGAGVVDQPHRGVRRRREALGDRHARPAAGQVRDVEGAAGRRVDHPRDADAHARDRAARRLRGHARHALGHAGEDGVGAVVAAGVDPITGDDRSGRVEQGELDEGATEVEADGPHALAGCRAHASTPVPIQRPSAALRAIASPIRSERTPSAKVG